MEFIQADTIDQYNRFFGIETRHPLVGIVHFDGNEKQHPHRMVFGFYALFLKQTHGCKINYGKTIYDYDDDTVVSFAPGQSVEIEPVENSSTPKAIGLLFHPEFLYRTPLAQKIKQYSFFSYTSNEALHLSQQEQAIIEDYMNKIELELQHPIDRFSKSLIVSNIEVLLNYCMRFYERQFTTRSKVNSDILTRFEKLQDRYFDECLSDEFGLPSVKYFANELCLSPNYFGDMLKKETGKTPQEYIQEKVIELAKERLTYTPASISMIAYSLGFQYPQHFCRLFKKRVGCTPNEYRAQNTSGL